IKKIQIYARLFTLLSLPLSYLVLSFSPNPYFPLIIIIVMDVFYWLYTVHVINGQLQVKYTRYIANVLLPIFMVSCCMVLTIFVLYWFLRGSDIFRFVMVFLVSGICGL